MSNNCGNCAHILRRDHDPAWQKKVDDKRAWCRSWPGWVRKDAQPCASWKTKVK